MAIDRREVVVADDLIRLYGSWLFILVAFGSLIDILQFSWILKRRFRAMKNRYRNKLRKELLYEEFERSGKRDIEGSPR